MPFNLDTCKIVIWGHKHAYHTQRHIHEAIARALPLTGRQTAWVDGEKEAAQYDFSNTLFLGEFQSIRGLPQRSDCFYLIHNVDENNRLSYFDGLQLMRWGVSVKTTVRPSDAVSLGNGAHFYPPVNCCPAMDMIWATDALPHEIEAMKPSRVYNPESNVINWVGTCVRGHNGEEVAPFRQACRDNGVDFQTYGGYNSVDKPPVSREHGIKLIQDSRFAPAILIGWQTASGYISCRSLKNISYGQFGVTNSPDVNALFEDKLAFNRDTYSLFQTATERLAKASLADLHRQMDIVAQNHTYVTRIESMLKAVRLALETK